MASRNSCRPQCLALPFFVQCKIASKQGCHSSVTGVQLSITQALGLEFVDMYGTMRVSVTDLMSVTVHETYVCL